MVQYNMIFGVFVAIVIKDFHVGFYNLTTLWIPASGTKVLI